jgi:hypothetical protein
MSSLAGRVAIVTGAGRGPDSVRLYQPYALVDRIDSGGSWTLAELAEKALRLGNVPFQPNNPFGR